MEHTDNALCTLQSVQRILVDKCALKFNIRLQNLFNRVSVQPTGAVGAACDGWLPGRGRFPPIGGRRGNTAATTLAAAADSRLTSFSLWSSQASLFRPRTAWIKMTEAPEAKRQKTNGFGHCSRRTSMEEDEVSAACYMLHVSCFLFMSCKPSCIGDHLRWNEHPHASLEYIPT